MNQYQSEQQSDKWNKIEMDRPKREKFLPKKLCDNEKDSKERFQCSYCKSNYAQKASLNTHVEQKHNKENVLGTKVHSKHDMECTEPFQCYCCFQEICISFKSC